MPNATREAVIRFREETLPASDPSHGTPNAVVRRSLEFELPQGAARWEQSDYGHPGRFNPWDPRGIDAALRRRRRSSRRWRTRSSRFSAPPRRPKL